MRFCRQCNLLDLLEKRIVIIFRESQGTRKDARFVRVDWVVGIQRVLGKFPLVNGKPTDDIAEFDCRPPSKNF